MTRPSYRHAIALLAEVDNDDATVETRANTVSVGIIASLFGVEPERVAADVLRYAERHP